MTTQTAIDRRNFLALMSAAAGTAMLATPAWARLGFNEDSDPILAWDTINKAGFHVTADQSSGGNCLIMTSDNQTLLIDTKFAHLGGALLADAATFAGSPDKLDLTLINTHHHGDHTGGNALIVPHATSYAHKTAVKRIKTSLDTYKQSAKSGPAQINRTKGSKVQLKLAIEAADASDSWTRADVAPKNRVPNEGMSITVGSTKIDMHHFGRGHTDNDLVVHFPEHNIIHTGDLVFAGLHPFFDQTARVTAFGWIKSLNKILELCDKDTIVVPGHGQVGTTQAVQNQLDYITQLIEHVQAELDKGSSVAEIRTMSWDFMDGLGFEGVRERAISAVCVELE